MIRRVKAFAIRQLGRYLQRPGDGRVAPMVPATTLLWSLLAAYLLRDGAFHAVETLVRSQARRALGVPRPFGDDTLAYFTARLEVAPTRTALVTLVRDAKRRKAFDDVWLIGLVLDGTTVGRCPSVRCPWCHPVVASHAAADGTPGPIGTVIGQQHKLSLVAVVGGAFVLPLDVEPYGPHDSEYGASLRLLDRSVAALGRRFAQYVVGDSLYANAPFLHAVGARGLHAVVRLKANLPTLYAAARARLEGTAPTLTVEERGARVELWDADDFDPWEDLRWPTVRVLRYRQYHADGTVVEAYWLTDFSARRVSTRTLYRLAKGRWTIENQGFNDSKTRYGLAHVPHHEATSLLIHWLLVAMTLTLERLYRLRYLHRGMNPPVSAIALVRRLRLSLGSPRPRVRLTEVPVGPPARVSRPRSQFSRTPFSPSAPTCPFRNPVPRDAARAAHRPALRNRATFIFRKSWATRSQSECPSPDGVKSTARYAANPALGRERWPPRSTTSGGTSRACCWRLPSSTTSTARCSASLRPTSNAQSGGVSSTTAAS